MVKKPFLYAFFCFSLVAGSLTDGQLEDLRKRYRVNDNMFEGYRDDARTLVVSFVSQDGTQSGVCVDIFKLAPEKQGIWADVDFSLLQTIFCDRSPGTWMMLDVTQTLWECVLNQDGSVRACGSLAMPRKDELRDVIGIPSFKSWKLALTSGALCGKPPGTVSITAASFECCLVREARHIFPNEVCFLGAPRFVSPAEAFIMQRQKAVHESYADMFLSLQETVDNVSTAVWDLSTTCKEMSRRLLALKESVQKKPKRQSSFVGAKRKRSKKPKRPSPFVGAKRKRS